MSRVQTRKTPPVLQPLANPASLPARRIIARIKLIRDYAERFRELDITEARELSDLLYLQAHGVLPPVTGTFRSKVKPLTHEDLLA